MQNKKVKLSERLKKILSFAQPNQDLWDLCCDHGYLGQAAFQSTYFKNIYFVDSAVHLIEKLKKEVHFPENCFALKAQEINIPVFGNVIIAGVGAELMISIIQMLISRNMLMADRLILSPHKDEDLLNHIHFTDYGLVQTDNVRERERVRPIFIFDRIEE